MQVMNVDSIHLYGTDGGLNFLHATLFTLVWWMSSFLSASHTSR